MEKTITLNLKNANFLRSMVENNVKAATEEDIIKKIKFFNATKNIKEAATRLAELVHGDGQSKTLELELEKVFTITLEVAEVDWLKDKWTKVPGEYKLINSKTGEVVQIGFTAEDDCRLYYDVKMAIEDARLVKEEEDKDSKKSK